MASPTKPPKDPKSQSVSPQKRSASTPTAKCFGPIMDSDTVSLSAARRKFSRVDHLRATNESNGAAMNLFKLPLFEMTNKTQTPPPADGKVSWKKREEVEEQNALLNIKLSRSSFQQLAMSVAVLQVRIKKMEGDYAAFRESANEKSKEHEDFCQSANEKFMSLENELELEKAKSKEHEDFRQSANEKFMLLENELELEKTKSKEHEDFLQPANEKCMSLENELELEKAKSKEHEDFRQLANEKFMLLETELELVKAKSKEHEDFRQSANEKFMSLENELDLEEAKRMSLNQLEEVVLSL